jgi:predicted SnoaL-like aldol condensation-catalyzing enzyme
MKKLFLFVCTVGCFAFFSCSNNNGGMSDKAKKNLDNARAIAKSFETKDISKLDDYIDKDVVDHAAPGGEAKGIENLKKMFQQMQSVMSDSKMETVKELADDDYVYQWMKESWTQTQEAMGMKPGSYTFNAIEVSKFNADSKVTEHWSFIDVNDMMKMMPPTPMNDSTSMNKMDSAGKKK